MLNCSSSLNPANLLSNYSGQHLWPTVGQIYLCHNYVELHSTKTLFLWIIYWEDCISLGPPLEHWHAGAMVGLSRLCAQAASLQGQTAFCIFMAGFTTRKWSFPGLWRQWKGWSGTTMDPSAQREMLNSFYQSISQLVCTSYKYCFYKPRYSDMYTL